CRATSAVRTDRTRPSARNRPTTRCTRDLRRTVTSTPPLPARHAEPACVTVQPVVSFVPFVPPSCPSCLPTARVGRRGHDDPPDPVLDDDTGAEGLGALDEVVQDLLRQL